MSESFAKLTKNFPENAYQKYLPKIPEFLTYVKNIPEFSKIRLCRKDMRCHKNKKLKIWPQIHFCSLGIDPIELIPSNWSIELINRIDPIELIQSIQSNQIESIKSIESIDSWTNFKLFRPKLSLNRTKNGQDKHGQKVDQILRYFW